MVALHIESIVILATAVEDLGLEVVEFVIVNTISLHRFETGEGPCSRRGGEGKEQCEKVGDLHRNSFLAGVVLN